MITNGLLDMLVKDAGQLLPEFVCVIVFLIILVGDLLTKQRFLLVIPYLSSLCFAGLVIYFSKMLITHPLEKVLFDKSLLINDRSFLFRILFDLAGLILTFYGLVKKTSGRVPEYLTRAEFHLFIWAMITGLHFLSMANSLLMAYLSLEMVSVSGYLITYSGFTSKSLEASFKYLVFGAVSTGVMLYGMSFLYGLSGHMEFAGIINPQNPYLLIGLVLTASGILFKVSAVPFHFWAPDVYEAIPGPIAAFLSVAPKAGGFALLMNFLTVQKINLQMANGVNIFLLIIASITILVGNFSAIWQLNSKRMLAYSSIAHTGFALCGLSTLTGSGAESCLYYLAIYLFMNFAGFLMVDFLSDMVGSEDVNKFKGLGMQVPLLGVIFVFIMIALTGLPPTAGFYAKLFVFSALWESYSLTSNNIFLIVFVFGLFNTVVSLFYYLRIPYYMFFKSPAIPAQYQSTLQGQLFFSMLAAPLLVLFLKPDILLKYINLLFR